MGRLKTPRSIHSAIGAGQKKRDYSGIRVPVLALFELPGTAGAPRKPDQYKPKNEEERAAIEAFDRATAVFIERWIRISRVEYPRFASSICRGRDITSF